MAHAVAADDDRDDSGGGDDARLLERYARRGDEAAFRELVRRRLDLVYSAAVRRVGDRHLAEDVTQAVFVVLARRPEAARASASLGAWLLTTVRYAAANMIKMERRRRRHERAAGEAAALASGAAGACSANPTDVLVWQELAGHLDDAVLRLPDRDRRAVVLRYFEQRPIRDVAAALDVTEAAAKQRLSRSVDKLRRLLARRAGTVTLATDGGTAAGLAGMLANHAVRAAPAAALTSACAASALAAGAGAACAATSLAVAKGAITMMTWTKVKTVAAGVAVAAVLGTGAAVTLNRAMAQDPSRAPAAGAGGALLALVAAPPAADEDADKAEREREDNATRERLKLEIPEVVFDGVALKDVVDFLMDVTNLPIVLDRPALIAAGIEPTTARVTVNVRKETVAKALELIGEAVGTQKDPVVFDVVGGVVVVSTKAGAKDFVKRHRAALAQASGPMKETLGRRLPEVTFDQVAIGDVLNFLRDVTAAKFEVDWDALNTAGVERTHPISVRARDLTLAQVLRLILDDAWAEKAIGFTAKDGAIRIGLAPDAKDPPKRKAEGL